MKTTLVADPDIDVSELRMAAAYGIEGLKNSTETTQHDEWLDLFGVVLDELNKPLQGGEGSFPVKEAVFPEEEKREEVVGTLRDLDHFSSEIKDLDPEERQEMQEDLNQFIEEAEGLYEDLERFS